MVDSFSGVSWQRYLFGSELGRVAPPSRMQSRVEYKGRVQSLSEVILRVRPTLAIAATSITLTASAHAADVYSDKDGFAISLGALVQPRLELTAPATAGSGTQGVGAPSGIEGDGISPGAAKGPSFDTYVRRALVSVGGSLDKQISLLVDVELIDFGRGGSFAPQVFFPDVILTYAFSPEFQIDAGMMPVPFARHTIEGVGTLNSLDLHDQMVRFPAGKDFRDTGLQVRGLLANALHFRLGVFEGARDAAALETPVEPVGAHYPDINEKGLPRFTGQLRYNIAGVETGFFLKGISFAKEPLVSIGVGGDFQPQAVLDPSAPDPAQALTTYKATSADLNVEYPFSDDDELIFKANAFLYGVGWSRSQESYSKKLAMENGGFTMFVEAGFRHAWIEPLAYVEVLKGKPTELAPATTYRYSSIQAYHLGVNFWAKEHKFNVKADVGYRTTQKDIRASLAANEWNRVPYKDVLGTIQGQVSF